jgi:hypothetical protein
MDAHQDCQIRQECHIKESAMRTTLDIDDSVLDAVKELARRQGSTAGAVLSTLARQALLQGATAPATITTAEAPAVYGFRPFSGKELVTNSLVDKLRDEQGV